jgi:hypothetical protein
VRHATDSSRDRDHPWNFRIGHFGKVPRVHPRVHDAPIALWTPDEQFPINTRARALAARRLARSPSAATFGAVPATISGCVTWL